MEYFCYYWKKDFADGRLQELIMSLHGNSGTVVDNTLDYQSTDRKFDSPYSGLSDEILNRGLVFI